MAMSMARFNQIQPGLEPKEMSARYTATLEMVEFAENSGFRELPPEEPRGAYNRGRRCALDPASLVFGRTKNIGITISALLLPLHDPLRVAEDIAVLDLASGG